MAIIPSGQKFHTVPAGVDTADRGSAKSNADRDIYTMQDIIDTVPGGGGGVTTFVALNDTPGSYSGATNKPVVVSASNTLVFSEQLKASIIGQSINYELSYTALASGGDYEGMVAKIGDAGNTLTAGTVYYWDGTQNDWVAADNTAEATSKGIMGIALGASGLSDGVLISGIYYFGTPPGSAAGDVLYLSTSGGLTETAPSTTGNYLRVMGQRLDANRVMFMPSQDFVEIGTTALSDLSDVTVTSPVAGQVLIYDAANSIFENNTLTAGANVSITEADGAITIGAGDGAEVEYKVRGSAVSADGEVEGSIVKFGTTTGMTAGDVYCWNGTNWVQVDANAEATTKGLLGVALGASSASDGLLTHGVAYLSHDPGTAGDVLYVHTAVGQVSATQPFAIGDFVRVAGYCLADNKVFFSPSQDFIEIG